MAIMKKPLSNLADWWKTRPLRCPWIVLTVLAPAVVSAFLIDRDIHDTDNILFYFIPDLATEPWRVIPNLVVTPLINGGVEQMTILFAVVGTLGIWLERREGAPVAVGAFWATSAFAALFAGVVWHLFYPLFPAVEFLQPPAERIYNGGSAGAFGVAGAFAARSRRGWILIALFLVWETGYWYVREDFIPVFHFSGFFGGYGLMKAVAWRRSRQTG
jgi:hypothetical protein